VTADRLAAGRAPAQFEYRPVRTDEIGACAQIWRVSINDYIVRLGQSEVQDETAPLERLYAHLQSTDPDRFLVAVDADDRVLAFGSAVMRERMWFLSMLFVLPEAQGAGIGRELLRRVGPPPGTDVVRATATDSLQPISNALYASEGIVPRVPLFNVVGTPARAEAFGPLPAGIRPVPFEDLVGAPGGDGHAELAGIVDALDRDLLGVAHPLDHRWIRTEGGRRGFLFRGPDGAPIGYGYAGESGRVGPIAVRDADLMAPVIGWLLATVRARGAYAMWLPGSADRSIVGALRAGLRFDEFPLLLCWDRPFVDTSRYLPISPGLL
jgi:GNAT superfamily N-acetyltransferase